MARKASTAATEAPAAKRTRTPRVKATDGSFPIKLRMEGVTEGHLAGLATKLGEKPRKITRARLKEWLHEQAQAALNTLHVDGPAAHSSNSAATATSDEGEDLLG